MSEENKNRGKDKGRQKNYQNMYNRDLIKQEEAGIPEDREFLNINNKRNKRHGRS